MRFHKVTFSLVKDLFNLIEGLRRSVIFPVGSKGALIVDLAGLRKTYLIGCQISSSKNILVRFHKKYFQPSQGLIELN